MPFTENRNIHFQSITGLLVPHFLKRISCSFWLSQKIVTSSSFLKCIMKGKYQSSFYILILVMMFKIVLLHLFF